MVADFKKKEKFFSNALLFKTFGILFFIIIIFFIFSDIEIYRKKRGLTAQINSYKKQIEEIKKSSQDLKEKIANSNNVDYLEKLAYEQLGQAKPGEIIYSFVTSPDEKKPTPKDQNFWQSMAGWLSGAVNWMKSKF